MMKPDSPLTLPCPHCGTTIKRTTPGEGDASDTTICPQCNRKIEEMRPPGKSGLALKKRKATPRSGDVRHRCPHCGNVLALGARICAFCRTNLLTGKSIDTRRGLLRKAGHFLLLVATYTVSIALPPIGILTGLVMINRRVRPVQALMLIGISIGVALGFGIAIAIYSLPSVRAFGIAFINALFASPLIP